MNEPERKISSHGQTCSRIDRVRTLETRRRILQKRIRKTERQLSDLHYELGNIERELNTRSSIRTR